MDSVLPAMSPEELREHARRGPGPLWWSLTIAATMLGIVAALWGLGAAFEEQVGLAAGVSLGVGGFIVFAFGGSVSFLELQSLNRVRLAERRSPGCFVMPVFVDAKVIDLVVQLDPRPWYRRLLPLSPSQGLVVADSTGAELRLGWGIHPVARASNAQVRDVRVGEISNRFGSTPSVDVVVETPRGERTASFMPLRWRRGYWGIERIEVLASYAVALREAVASTDAPDRRRA
ncbi:hypothetical protein ARHIZOSPH14_07130 [Agromyces rhizosphaerae]|uniref:Uncharacterized protein n=1 Tax=Agromyces rhizosphaerae TaxID=88374 RepID=A0A9W6CPK8_9MICO|nr:hypothetical protein [Agromyces rhizosphaerae]GLI26471.1 hypothetical protein ARHIZOSPH14_07130 [Agromyces rhizosphaerae]